MSKLKGRKRIKSSLSKQIVADSTINTTTSSEFSSTLSFIVNENDLQYDIKKKSEDTVTQVNNRVARQNAGLKSQLDNFLLMLMPEQRELLAPLDTIADLENILSGSLFETPSVESPNFASALNTVKRAAPRRSRSFNRVEERLSTIRESPRKRASSAGDSVSSSTISTTASRNNFKTPTSRFPVSRLFIDTKYTVKKPMKDTRQAVNFKRVMKANEEAISTAGSPLFVQSGAQVSQPYINIPLEGGVIVNIEPKKMGSQSVPQLDAETKKKLKILVENVNKFLE